MLTPKKITKKEIMADALFLRKQKESKAPSQLQSLQAAAKSGNKTTIAKIKKGGTIGRTVAKKARVRKMAAGGSSGCPEGYQLASDGTCQPLAGTKLLRGSGLGMGIIGGLGSAMGAVASMTSQKSMQKRAADNIVDTTMNTINAPMKKGGVVKKGMGFKAAQKSIMKKQGLSKKSAGAILASGARKASATAKRKNPNLKKVKSSKK